MNIFTADKIPGRLTQCDGQEYLFFSGTSYLAMNSNKRFINQIQEGQSKYGSNYGSSRNSNFRLAVYEQAENALAKYAGAEAATTLSSGYLAGQLLSKTIIQAGYAIYAPDTHPALWRNTEDCIPGDYVTWLSRLHDKIHLSDSEEIIIVCNSLDPLHAKSYDFNWVHQLPVNKKFTLIIDDSHGFGVTGIEGSGIFRQIQGGPNVRLIVICSLAKAMGIPGGAILSDKNTAAFLTCSPFYSASSPIPPAYLYAYCQAADLYGEARLQLKKNIDHFKGLMKACPLFRQIPDFPVFYTPENQMAGYLQKNGLLISSFPYPLPGSDCISRIILNSSHQPEDIHFLHRSILKFIGDRVLSD